MKELTFILCLVIGSTYAQGKTPITLNEIASKSLASAQKNLVIHNIGESYLYIGASSTLDAQCASTIHDLLTDITEAQAISKNVNAYVANTSGSKTIEAKYLVSAATLLYNQRLALYSALTPICAYHEDMSARTAVMISELNINNSALNAAMLNMYIESHTDSVSGTK